MNVKIDFIQFKHKWDWNRDKSEKYWW